MLSRACSRVHSRERNTRETKRHRRETPSCPTDGQRSARREIGNQQAIPAGLDLADRCVERERDTDRAAEEIGRRAMAAGLVIESGKACDRVTAADRERAIEPGTCGGRELVIAGRAGEAMEQVGVAGGAVAQPRVDDARVGKSPARHAAGELECGGAPVIATAGFGGGEERDRDPEIAVAPADAVGAIVGRGEPGREAIACAWLRRGEQVVDRAVDEAAGALDLESRRDEPGEDRDRTRDAVGDAEVPVAIRGGGALPRRQQGSGGMPRRLCEPLEVVDDARREASSGRRVSPLECQDPEAGQTADQLVLGGVGVERAEQRALDRRADLVRLVAAGQVRDRPCRAGEPAEQSEATLGGAIDRGDQRAGHRVVRIVERGVAGEVGAEHGAIGVGVTGRVTRGMPGVELVGDLADDVRDRLALVRGLDEREPRHVAFTEHASGQVARESSRRLGARGVRRPGYDRGRMTSARDWLIAGAPGALTSPEVLAGTCERLVAVGVPIARAEAYVRTLHPVVAGRAFEWTPAGCRAIDAAHADDLDVASSPIQHVFRTGKPQRNRLEIEREGCPYLDELVSQGMTDVIALPFLFTSGEVHAVAFATDRAGGFTADDVPLIEGVVEPLTRMAEILALRRTATNVLTAYVGRDAGARVLAGKIRRGDVELIEAAIWFSDMRGFSTLSNERGPREVIDLLNELFDCQVPAIERHGGEVLKFIGDGLLAIFTPGDDGMRGCCERALAATRDAATAVQGRPIRFGIALHVGEVGYGNIGSVDRLDFTCIGRAVNLAARLESLTGSTGHDVLASAEFAAHCDGFAPVGEFAVKGFLQPVVAYARTVRPPR